MKPKGEMVVLEARVKFNLGDAVRVTNKFNPHYKQKGWVVGACKGPSEIIDDVDTIYYYVNIDDLLYKFAEREIKEDKVMNATEEENKDVTYFGLVRGRTYKLKQNHYPMKEGDPVLIKDFDPIDPTSGDRADVLVFHALYGTQWVNHSELEDTIQPMNKEDTFKPGDPVNLRADYKTWGIKLPCPNLILRVVEQDNLEETECYWLRDAYGHTYYAPAEILIPVKAKANEHHYDGEVQPIELMQAQMTKEAFIGFLRGNIIKYAARLGKKDAPEKEAKKIQTYANWLVKVLNNQEIHP